MREPRSSPSKHTIMINTGHGTSIGVAISDEEQSEHGRACLELCGTGCIDESTAEMQFNKHARCHGTWNTPEPDGGSCPSCSMPVMKLVCDPEIVNGKAFVLDKIQATTMETT